MDPVPASTPWYADKTLYVTLLGVVLPLINKKFGLSVDPVEIAGILALVVGYVASSKWKQASMGNTINTLAASSAQQSAALSAVAQRPSPALAAMSPLTPPVSP